MHECVEKEISIIFSKFIIVLKHHKQRSYTEVYTDITKTTDT